MTPSDVKLSVFVITSPLGNMQGDVLSAHVALNVDTKLPVLLLHLLSELGLGLPVPDPHLLEQDVGRVEDAVRVAAQRPVLFRNRVSCTAWGGLSRSWWPGPGPGSSRPG